MNTDCNSNLKKSGERNKLYTNQSKKKTILYRETNQVTFFNVKFEKFVGGNSRQSFAFPVSGMLGGGI